jgi:hypothetical protein
MVVACFDRACNTNYGPTVCTLLRTILTADGRPGSALLSRTASWRRTKPRRAISVLLAHRYRLERHYRVLDLIRAWALRAAMSTEAPGVSGPEQTRDTSSLTQTFFWIRELQFQLQAAPCTSESTIRTARSVGDLTFPRQINDRPTGRCALGRMWRHSPVSRLLAYDLAHQCLFIPPMGWADVVRRRHVFLRRRMPQQGKHLV